ncbi:hypothetical protein FACS18942_06540 [Planctomycetales bacterium]|nr:hypothetical protein FACS18942_06540 [Planctomycetales bacterium]
MHCIRLAASRAACTAGKSNAISTPKALNVGPKKDGSYDSELGPPLLRPIPVGALIEKVMGNPYLSSQEKETSVSTFDWAQSLGGKWVTPVTFD